MPIFWYKLTYTFCWSLCSSEQHDHFSQPLIWHFRTCCESECICGAHILHWKHEIHKTIKENYQKPTSFAFEIFWTVFFVVSSGLSLTSARVLTAGPLTRWWTLSCRSWTAHSGTWQKGRHSESPMNLASEDHCLLKFHVKEKIGYVERRPENMRRLLFWIVDPRVHLLKRSRSTFSSPPLHYSSWFVASDIVSYLYWQSLLWEHHWTCHSCWKVLVSANVVVAVACSCIFQFCCWQFPALDLIF